MTRIAAGFLCAALAVAAVARPAEARKDEDETSDDGVREARAHFKRGEKLFALGKFEDALAAYEAAYDANPLPELLFNIGQCHRNLEDYDAAIFSFKKYLRLKPSASNRKAVEKLIDELEDERAAERERQREQEEEQLGRVPLIPKDGDRDATPPTKRDPAFYQTWWFWTGVVIVGAGAGTAIYLGTSGGGLPDSDLGNLDFPR
jgi:tetratricopeptide (TPR) repeat protein